MSIAHCSVDSNQQVRSSTDTDEWKPETDVVKAAIDYARATARLDAEVMAEV